MCMFDRTELVSTRRQKKKKRRVCVCITREEQEAIEYFPGVLKNITHHIIASIWPHISILSSSAKNKNCVHYSNASFSCRPNMKNDG